MAKISFKKVEEAVLDGNLDLVKQFVAEGKFDLNTKNRKEQTPLFIAVEQITNIGSNNNKNLRQSQLSIVKYMVENGADLDVLIHESWTGDWTPLGKALESREDNFDLVKLLVENGANINNPDCGSNSPPLMLAVTSTNNRLRLQTVKYLIDKGADVNGKHKNSGKSVLYEACATVRAYDESTLEQKKDIQLEVVKCLVENGADTNAQNNSGKYGSGETPLHSAIKSEDSNLELIKYIVENSDTTIIENPYTSPIFLTCNPHPENNAPFWFSYFSENFSKIFKSEIFKNNYLIEAAYYRQFSIMEDLLELGADINATSSAYLQFRPDDRVDTALLNFTSCDRQPIKHPYPRETAVIDCIQFLIDKGAEIDVLNSDGKNLLHLLVESIPNNENQRIENGYDISGKGLELFKFLIDSEVPFDKKNIQGDTVKELLINKRIVEWLNYIEELENKNKTKKSIEI